MSKYLKLVAVLSLGVIIGACFPSMVDELGVPDAGAQAANGYEYQLEYPVRDSSGYIDQLATVNALNQRGQGRWRVVATVQGYSGQTSHFVLERQR